MDKEKIKREELKGIIEALIFVSAEGVTRERLAELLECQPDIVQELVDELTAGYRERSSGLAVLNVANGYQMATTTAAAPWVEKLMTVIRRRQLSQAAMETLAIIAYRQPVTRAEVEAIRGVDTGRVIGGLLEKNLIRITGRKKAPGRPLVYATSRDFLVRFGLNSLKDLPALTELGQPGALRQYVKRKEEG